MQSYMSQLINYIWGGEIIFTCKFPTCGSNKGLSYASKFHGELCHGFMSLRLLWAISAGFCSVLFCSSRGVQSHKPQEWISAHSPQQVHQTALPGDGCLHPVRKLHSVFPFLLGQNQTISFKHLRHLLCKVSSV